jgi:hypothetical protein
MCSGALQDDGARELERLVRQEDYAAVRFNPYLWPEGEKMDNPRGRAMFRRCAATCATFTLDTGLSAQEMLESVEGQPVSGWRKDRELARRMW